MAIKENELKLPNGKIITFNDEQSEGVKKMKQWLQDRNGDSFFCLAGYAGTGKSTIVKKILDKYYNNVVVSAPTHKAKKVIMNTTGREGKTLHSLLGLRPDLDLADFNPNDPKFEQKALPQITDYNLVIIDEASMINLELYNRIKKETKGRKVKVLFVGDPAQIPPVGEQESAVFNAAINQFHQLKKIERQDGGNPLSYIYEALRNNLTDVDGGIQRITQLNDKKEGVIFTVRKKEFRDAVVEKYLTAEYKKNSDFAKMIAWKNDTVIASNKVIRSQLFNNTKNIIELGETLMGYRTIMDERQRVSIVENSADYHVDEVNKKEENEYGLQGYRIGIREDLAHGKTYEQDVFILDINDRNNLYTYADMHDFFRDEAKKHKHRKVAAGWWRKYYEFRRCNLLMRDIEQYRNGQLRSSYDRIKKDLDYGYAITGHKSQGSTYSHVFIMENDINSNWVVKERNQIKYVAFTRPTTSATALTTKLD